MHWHPATKLYALQMIHSITGHKAKLLHTNNIDNLLLTIMYSAINCDLTVVSFGKEYKGGSIFRLLDYCLFLPYSESYLIKKHFFDFYMILICLFVKSWGRGRSDLLTFENPVQVSVSSQLQAGDIIAKMEVRIISAFFLNFQNSSLFSIC